MNYKKLVVAAVLLSTFSAGAMAAKEISREEAQKNNYTSLGTVSISNEQTAPMDAKRAINKLVEEKGGKYYVVIEANNDNKISATAEAFK
ncbi:YdgH/BhsA/McbA-like domain containing protein [Rouxiella sp. T17]|uniref:YdgH/BhsA/McbA-like domain containing protein n=1 Tax=Rouxiella sp. T17 TaxID=3085684 RepID=UPI002FC80BFA